MPLSGIWNELKKESACKKFELRGTEDIWGIYCTESDNISDPDFSQKCKGKTESELKKAHWRRSEASAAAWAKRAPWGASEASNTGCE